MEIKKNEKFDSFMKEFKKFIHENNVSNPPRIIAASKMQSIETIAQIHLKGQKYFGENYCDELLLKAKDLKTKYPDIHFSYIGQLQANKISRIMEAADEIQTVSSLKHVRYISRIAKEKGYTRYPVYIHVNLGSEANKGGLDLDSAQNLAVIICSEYQDSILLEGLMTIPPKEYSLKASSMPLDLSFEEKLSPYINFVTKAKKIGQGKASIGMSSDWKAAILAGSSCIRVGTSMFGPRN